MAEIDMEQKKVKVMIEMFGRMTPVEVDFNSVEEGIVSYVFLVGDDNTSITTQFMEVN